MTRTGANSPERQVPLPGFVLPGKDGWYITVKVQPGAPKNELRSTPDGTLHIKLKAQALENKANEALLIFLAQLLEVRKTGIMLTSGAKSRNKRIFVSADLNPNWDALRAGPTS